MKTKASVAPHDHRSLLERQAIALSKFCPIDRSNPDGCPLCNLRLLSVRGRREWVHGLTLGDLRYLVLYHANCAAVRAQTIKPN